MQILVVTTDTSSDELVDIHNVLHFLMDNAPVQTTVKVETTEEDNPQAYASITKVNDFTVLIDGVYFNVPDGVDEVMSNFYWALV